MLVNPVHHLIDGLIHCGHWNAYDSVATSSHVRIPSVVSLNIVPRTIDLDNESSGVTQKVHEVGADWDLTPELVTRDLPTTKARPYAPFDLGHIVSEMSGLIGSW